MGLSRIHGEGVCVGSGKERRVEHGHAHGELEVAPVRFGVFVHAYKLDHVVLPGLLEPHVALDKYHGEVGIVARHIVRNYLVAYVAASDGPWLLPKGDHHCDHRQ